MVRRPDKKKLKKEGKDKVIKLFEEASKIEDIEKARKLVHKARRIAMKVRIRIPESYNRRYCRKCEVFWVIGKTVRKRTRNGKIVYKCLKCGNIKRVPYK